MKVAKPTQRYTAEEAQALLANSTPGRGDGVIRRDHRTLYAGLPGEGADAENVREYEIGVAHIATGDAKLFAAAPGLVETVVAQAQGRRLRQAPQPRGQCTGGCDRESAVDLTLTDVAIRGLFRRGSPVYESGRSGIQGCRGVVVPASRGEYLVIRWEQEARGMETTITGGAALDMQDPTGRFHALLWLRERGHDLRWAQDEAEVLAWSVLSVAMGGRPIAGIKSLVLDETRRAALAAGYALRNDNNVLILPPLPEVPRG